MSNELLDSIIENFEDEGILLADGFDDAVIGIDNNMRLIYSVSRCVEILMKEGMSHEDALEHLSYNTMGAYVGEKIPIFCIDNF
jgi:hypothetical protein